MNDALKFVPDGSYDELIFRWMNIMLELHNLEIYKSGFKKIKEGFIFRGYTSYLPKEKFDEVMEIGFQMVKERTVPEYINFVFDILCFEGIQTNYTRLQLGEIILLKRLFSCIISEDFEEFENIYVAMCSLDMNKVISTKFYNCGIINMDNGEAFNIEIITDEKTED